MTRVQTGLDDDESYLVLWHGRLTASTREELPPVRGTALMRRIGGMRAKDPGGRTGWYAHPPDSGEPATES